MTAKSPVTQKWWKESVIYQVYPRSFKDSNGDGIGDLRGIIEKLDYLKDLGVNIIWICPIFKSPQDDNGYDVSDYQDIHHEFGSMQDFNDLLKGVHDRGMKLILDLVLNHTSDEHPWFIESRSSKDNSKRDWYIWRDGKNGAEPNNWESIFSGSAWKLDPETNQYFMHVFSARQPDLNWENKDMRQAAYDMVNWWLDKGIDGFRIDAISHIKKRPGLPDLPNPQGLKYVPSYANHMNVDGVMDYIGELCRETFSKYDIVTVGEANGVNSFQAQDWVAEEKKRFSMLIQFEHTKLWDHLGADKFDLAELKTIFTNWQTNLHGIGWNALFVENHDITRVVSKWGDPFIFHRESATSIAAMYFLMQGSPFIYQGQELGMTNTEFSGPEDFQDVAAKNLFVVRRAEGMSDIAITKELAGTSRDNARTPMQWNGEENAGFTTGKPWLKVNPNYKTINVETEEKDPKSVLNFYKQLIRLRRDNKIFIYGDFEMILQSHTEVFAYTRHLNGQTAWIICNVKGQKTHVEMPAEVANAKMLISNYENPSLGLPAKFELRPFECRVYIA
ncbi:MAG: alpha-glucosidase [Bdellovibrionales bacterium]|nr:alpha-glucosidase [Bdellovibrionales bacterium]